MSKYYPRDYELQYEAERLRIQREQEGLRQVLSLLDIEEQHRIRKAQWQIENEETLEKTILALKELYYEKRLAALERYSDRQIRASRSAASAEAAAIEEYFTRTKDGRDFQRGLREAAAFDALAAPLKVSLAKTQTEVDLSRVKKVRVLGVEAFSEQVSRQIERDVQRFRYQTEEFIDYGYRIGMNIARGIARGEPVLKAALKGILSTMLQFLEDFVIAAEVKSAVENFVTLGPWAIVKSAAETAVLTTLLETFRQQVLAFGSGGILREPVAGFGLTTRKPYLLGENGPEAVVPLTRAGGRMQAGASLSDDSVLRELRGLRGDIASLRLQVRGTDLALAVDRGAALRRGRCI